MALSKKQRWMIRIGALVVVLAGVVWLNYSRIINWVIPYEHRSETIDFAVQHVSDEEFEQLAAQLQKSFSTFTSVDTAAQNPAVYRAVAQQLAGEVSTFKRRSGLSHIDRFRKAGIRSYEGAATCLTCHEEMRVKDGKGGFETVNTRDNIEQSVHFGLNKFSGFNTYGFNGELVKGIPMGKIDRACGIPGSFTWTGWATIVKTKSGETRSDGCGQCHPGGQYGPMTGTMFPGYSPTTAEFESVDCLICHSAAYDMNEKYVVKDDNGKHRWNQDRGMKAAMAVGRPTSDNCLRCHEHNHGGDMYEKNLAAQALGYKNPRLLHPGAKRGNPTRGADVHYQAGLQCLDCHESHGHLIARGTRGTDLVSNDLPGVEVSCEKCHSATPHIQNKVLRAFLNAHTDKLACETCHITHLTDENVVLRDWTDPVFSEEEGVWVYRDILRSGKPGEALIYRWHNGNGSFMAGALGDNPNGLNLYRSFTTTPDDAYKNFNYATYYEKTFRPLGRMGKSKIAPFKRFNAKMYEDMGNQGPFGGMLLPFDYNVYYETGNPKASVMKAMQDPIIQMMYGTIFKLYMMDAFMNYMGIEKGWTIPFSGKIEGKWMRQDATLMLNHSITKDAMKCESCHAEKEKGVMPFEELGYPAERVNDLRNLQELRMVNAARPAPAAAAKAKKPSKSPALSKTGL
ncbi:MAG: cytochrome c3 family protein [Ignavibacteria bacterium]|nr:cytochrome c3 family protein [Ignavibacteria bacterium]